MKYEIEVISPVHVGSGGGISPIEYVLEDKFYRADMDGLFADERFESDRFIEDAKVGALYLGRFDSELAKEHVRYALDISQPTRTNLQGLIGKRSSEVREFIKTKDDAYIPGSSVKGAIRTAILWWVLKNDRQLLEKAERYLEILLNARDLSERIENAGNLGDIKREIEINQNLKQKSDVYMGVLEEIAGGEVRKIKKKVGNLSKIGREHVDDEIEKLVFGADPTKDLLKALQVSDSNAIAVKNLKVEEVRTLTTTPRGHNWKSFYIYVEALKCGAKLDLEMKTVKFLLEGDAASELDFESKKVLVREIPKICNEFVDDFIESEIRFFKQCNTQRELDKVIEFYERMRREENSFLLHLAWGSGWHGMTVGRLLQEDTGFDFFGLRKKFRLGKRRNQPFFVRMYPKTRRIVFENGKPKYPLGWVKLEEKDE
ncbi:MAG: type III-A CRISPR-associated RAMP protein Csm5 [Methanophagales archaeon]|nr:type III-A CRISPR-associated RAMP protein Csm5 [Methanophagales archaeon]